MCFKVLLVNPQTHLLYAVKSPDCSQAESLVPLLAALMYHCQITHSMRLFVSGSFHTEMVLHRSAVINRFINEVMLRGQLSESPPPPLSVSILHFDLIYNCSPAVWPLWPLCSIVHFINVSTDVIKETLSDMVQSQGPRVGVHVQHPWRYWMALQRGLTIFRNKKKIYIHIVIICTH